MSVNHLKIALRNLLKNRTVTAINVFGLAVGLACSMVIVFYVIGELGYDRHLGDGNRIYRVITRWKSPTSEGWRNFCSAPLVRTLQRDFPQIEATARVVPPYENDNRVLVVNGVQRCFEKRIFFVDPEIVDFFPLRFLKGNPQVALKEMNSVVITSGMARKYFGEDDPMGKTVHMEFDYDLGSENVRLEAFSVSGVLADPPKDSHFQYHMLVSMATMIRNREDFEENWLNYHPKYSYVKLRENVDPREVASHLNGYVKLEKALYEKRFGRSLNQERIYHLQALGDIHMHELKMVEREPGGNWMYLGVYALIAALVLLIGCMNFINLSTALSTTRIKEVGVKKVVGADRGHLVRQFLGEAFLTTFLAYLLAMGLCAILLPFFNEMAQTRLSLLQIGHPLVMMVLLLIFIITGTISGAYPALILARYKPVKILQGRFSLRSRGNSVHNLLVVGQFSISVFLLLTTLFVFRQLSFMKGQSLGFDKEQKLILHVKSGLHHLRHDFETVIAAFEADSSIIGAAVSSDVPGGDFSGGYGIWREGANRNDSRFIKVLTVTPGFLELYGIPMAYGRSFRKGSPGDVSAAFIMNREALRELGFDNPEKALGQNFTAHYHGKTKSLVGVTEDFHVRGMKEKIIPLVLDIEESLMEKITLGVRGGMLPRAMEFVRETWREQFPDVPFEYSFLDESFDRVYRYEEQMSRMLTVITALGMLVAFLGLSGLAGFVTWKRRREIGIRKVIGASSVGIIRLISGKLLMLVSIAICIATPLAWLAINRWLEGFATHISLDIHVFFAVALGVLLTALASVILQTLRSLKISPVLALKEE